ncbi:MAG: GNAT family N-acetyltransferase [Rhizobiaceae bacterium]|nr:GNAT family N-acetyltransferase [Rhizobiaceae bacterium]
MADADLPTVRRLEAAGFRAWPAEKVSYDGTWSVRTTPGLPTRRSNSVTPLDRSDCDGLERRLPGLRARFADAGFPITFRITPLTGQRLVDQLDERGWPVITPSLVMRAELGSMPDAGAEAEMVSAAAFCRAGISIGAIDAARSAPLEALFARVPGKTGLFVLSVDGKPAAKAMCTVDGALAGIYEVATATSFRGKGLARKVVSAALGFARGNGARAGFLMVDENNAPAIALYKTFGFSTAYPYEYRAEPETT